jgi:hypothetical protein
MSITFYSSTLPGMSTQIATNSLKEMQRASLYISRDWPKGKVFWNIYQDENGWAIECVFTSWDYIVPDCSLKWLHQLWLQIAIICSSFPSFLSTLGVIQISENCKVISQWIFSFSHLSLWMIHIYIKWPMCRKVNVPIIITVKISPFSMEFS